MTTLRKKKQKIPRVEGTYSKSIINFKTNWLYMKTKQQKTLDWEKSMPKKKKCWNFHFFRRIFEFGTLIWI